MNSVHHKRISKLCCIYQTAKRNHSGPPPRIWHPSEPSPAADPIRFHNFYGNPYPSALSRVTGKKRATSCYDAVLEGPIKISVKLPRNHTGEERALEVQENYCVPCHIPWELSDKYPIHRPDPSIRFSTDNIRPTILEVIIPVGKPSENEKFTQLPSTIMRDYPAPRNDDDK